MRITYYRYRIPRSLTGVGAAVLIAVLTLLFLIGFGIGRAESAGVSLAWDYTQSPDPNAQADSFVIQRCQGAGCTTFADLPIPPIPVTTTTYLDTAVQPGTTYRWRVLAKGASGASAPSNAVSFLVPQTPPAAPSNLRGSWQP
jgi:hypothetical protein